MIIPSLVPLFGHTSIVHCRPLTMVNAPMRLHRSVLGTARYWWNEEGIEPSRARQLGYGQPWRPRHCHVPSCSLFAVLFFTKRRRPPRGSQGGLRSVCFAKTALGEDLRILRSAQTRMTAIRDDAPETCCEEDCRPRFHGFFVLLVALRRASGSESSRFFSSETKKAASGIGTALKHEFFEGRVSALLQRRIRTDDTRGSSRAAHTAYESPLSSHVENELPRLTCQEIFVRKNCCA